jgi:hypothetical protein
MEGDAMTPEESHAITIEGYTALRKDYDRLYRMYQEQKAEIERLKSELSSYCGRY